MTFVELSVVSTVPRVSFDGRVNNGYTEDDNENDFSKPVSNYPNGKAKTEKYVNYSWNNLNAWVGSGEYVDDPPGKDIFGRTKPENKILLNSVSGVLRPSELVAVVGSSGAGKSTLMDVLTFRNSGSVKVSGQRAINGIAIDSSTITSIAAYVQQVDLFVGILTVREHLMFQAQVRMNSKVSNHQRVKRVEEVIEELGLAKCADSRIGTKWLKGISGGEMRRLSIATELLTDPLFMCCDEPTSGLDSRSAYNMVTTLRDLAKTGKTVTCTIHQPSSALFTLFDRVLIMSEGRIAYLGPVAECLEFLNELGYPCPQRYNPADFLIETMAVYDADTGRKVHEICEAFEASPAAAQMKVKNIRKRSVAGDMFHKPPKYKVSWGAQFFAVLRRSWISFIRDPMVLKMRILQTIVLGLFVGTIYFQEEIHRADGIQNLCGAIFMLLVSLTYQCVFGVLDTFCSELPVFLREHFNGMYRTDVYFLSKMIVEVPFFIILPTIFTSISYFMVGLDPNFESFVKTAGILMLVNYICSGIGYFLSCIAKAVTIALLLAPVILFPFFLFGGFLVRPDSGVVFLRWIQHISWFFYGYESIAIIQLENLDHIECNSNSTCPANGFAVLESLNFDKDNLITDVLALVGIGIGVTILSYLALLSKTIRK